MGAAVFIVLLTVILVLGLIAFWLERVDRRLVVMEKVLASRIRPVLGGVKLVHNGESLNDRR